MLNKKEFDDRIHTEQSITGNDTEQIRLTQLKEGLNSK